MAVKLPPNTWVSQVITLKGFRDDVYSKIDGSLVGYVKDGKFIQTIDKLPKLDPKKKPVQDKKFAASIAKISALNAIPALEFDAAYYKEQAENVNNTPQERAKAKAQYDALNAQVEAKRKEAGQAEVVVEEEQGKERATSAKNSIPKIQSEFTKLKKQYDILLDPSDPEGKGPGIKKKLDTLAQDYTKLYRTATGTPVISKTAAFARLANNQGTQFPATQTGTAKDVDKLETYTVTIKGKPTKVKWDPAKETLFSEDGSPYTGAVPWADQTITYKDGKKVSSTADSTTEPKVTSGGTTGGTTGGRTGGTTGGRTGGTTGGATGSGKPISGAFDPAAFRAGEEASMGSTPPVLGGAVVKGYDSALALAKEKYNLPDIIFSNVKSLGKILEEYVNGKIDIDLFKQKVANDPWYRQNSTEIKARYLQKFNYDDLVKSGNAKGTTDYEQKIAQITNNLLTKARQMGSALDEGQAKLMAEDLYIFNQDADDAVVTRRLVSGIRPIAGMVGGRITEDFSGLALQNYQGLQSLAKRNGMKLENILPPGVDGKPATAQETLQRLALGELDPTRLAQDVRKLAAVGQPQFVRDLLGQGIDLDQIYSPYRRTMARVLELDEGQIDLMDPTLRKGINDKGDINLFDYEKSLRQDNRWQYTGNARQEVSDAALTVLRNFGFQG